MIELKAIEALQKDIDRANQAIALLEKIWSVLGPYHYLVKKEGKTYLTTDTFMTEAQYDREVKYPLQDFFNFDDSE